MRPLQMVEALDPRYVALLEPQAGEAVTAHFGAATVRRPGGHEHYSAG